MLYKFIYYGFFPNFSHRKNAQITFNQNKFQQLSIQQTYLINNNIFPLFLEEAVSRSLSESETLETGEFTSLCHIQKGILVSKEKNPLISPKGTAFSLSRQQPVSFKARTPRPKKWTAQYMMHRFSVTGDLSKAWNQWTSKIQVSSHSQIIAILAEPPFFAFNE